MRVESPGTHAIPEVVVAAVAVVAVARVTPFAFVFAPVGHRSK
jgi:hypothetical protein